MKYFISVKDASELILEDLSLLDDNLVVKSTNKDGTFNIEPIISIGGFDKHDVNQFEIHLNSKGKELLYKSDKETLTNTKFIDIDFTIFKELGNGSYSEIIPNFEPRKIELLNYDVNKVMKNNKEWKEESKAVVVLPSKIDKESLFYTDKTSVIAIGDKVSSRREYLSSSRLGSDLYVLPYNQELLDEYPRYKVELIETEKNKFKMLQRYYYFIQKLSSEELSYLNEQEKEIYKKLTKNKADCNIIVKNQEEPESVFQLGIHEVEPLVDFGLDAMPFKHLFKVYNQEGLDLIPTSLEVALGFENNKTL